jgi:hypothetical protein
MNAAVQNLIALTVAAVAGLWLIRSLWKRLWAAPCAGISHDTPAGTDGFVSLDALIPKDPPT